MLHSSFIGLCFKYNTMKYCKNCGKLTIIKKDRYECDCDVVYPKAANTVIVYNDYPPECYGNLKKLCDSKKVSYSTHSKKKFPFTINGNEVFKVEVKKGDKKEKKKI